MWIINCKKWEPVVPPGDICTFINASDAVFELIPELWSVEGSGLGSGVGSPSACASTLPVIGHNVSGRGGLEGSGGGKSRKKERKFFSPLSNHLVCIHKSSELTIHFLTLRHVINYKYDHKNCKQNVFIIWLQFGKPLSTINI